MPTDRPSAATLRFPYTTLDNKTPSSSTLPPQVQAAVPLCARPCLAKYISQEYNCPYNDFLCLCEEYSSQGFTLGELAFLCLRQDCGSTKTNESVSVYNICNGNAAAVPATHSTLTLPETRSSKAVSTLSSSSTQRSHPQTTKHTSTTSPDTISTAARSSAVPAAMGSSASQTGSLTSSTAAAATSSGHATSLTSAQAVGVSIAAMGTVMLVIGAIYFITCIRRRKVKQRDERKSYDFVDEAPPRFSPFTYGYADPRGPLGGFHKPRVELMADKRNSEWYRKQYSHRPPPRVDKNVDFDLSPESYRSKSSGRTLSQLLPEKPNTTTPPRPPPRSPRPASVFTAATVFEEDRSPPTATSNLFSPTYPRAVYYPPVKKARPPQQAKDYQHSPREERRLQQRDQNHRHSPRSERQPSLSLAIPRQASRLDRIPSPTVFPPPPIPKDKQPESPQRISASSKACSSKSGVSLLNYYASPEAGSGPSPEKNSPTPIDDEIQKRKPVPTAITVTKPIFPPRAVRQSAASDTSFESTDPDEPTPPEEEDKQLTPVQDTPVEDSPSPIAGIRYPKVPRSSNQSVPRSPNLKQSPDKKQPPNIKLSRGVATRPEAGAASTKDLPSQIPLKATAAPKQNPITPPSRTHSKTPSLSGSTLAAKRRGNSAAIDMEQRLHIAELRHFSSAGSPLPPNTSKSDPPPSATASSPRRTQRTSRQESPLKGYGRVTSAGGQRGRVSNVGTPISAGIATSRPEQQQYWSPGLPGPTQEVPALRSPPWDPKLTPSRRGKDLYLQVGVATPSTAEFAPTRPGDRR